MASAHVNGCMQTFWETARPLIMKIVLVIVLKVKSI